MSEGERVSSVIHRQDLRFRRDLSARQTADSIKRQCPGCERKSALGVLLKQDRILYRVCRHCQYKKACPGA
jgi:CRISPR/Cas system-associated protein Cas10 (large subunit of type III CRISPR-Cas system)